MLALSERSSSGEVWLLLCLLCFSGSLLFGIRAGLDPKGFNVTYGNPGVMVVRETCP